METKKKLQELTFKDNFMFGAVMMEGANCREFLELALGISIERVEVDKEKSLIYHPEYKGVRLDAYAKDEKNTRYNIEMQVVKKPALGKRVRYYHSQIDMELLVSGHDYKELPEAYVIFICDFDPFDRRKYCYTFENRCLETSDLKLPDGCRSVFLSTHGKNRNEVSEELVEFLRFVSADLESSNAMFESDFVKHLQNTIRQIKASREMGERFMLFSELLEDERAAGKVEDRAEVILELLDELGVVPEKLRERILAISDLELLKKWHKLAAKAESIEAFQQEIQ